MNYQPIVKPAPDRMPVRPNLIDYPAARASFRWDAVRAELDGLPGGGLNIAFECIDRHLETNRRDKIAMLWEGKDGRAETYTFAQMAAASNKAANALRALGVEKGDRVFAFLERVPELYFAVFGALKLGAVIGPLFSAFGPAAVRARPVARGAQGGGGGWESGGSRGARGCCSPARNCGPASRRSAPVCRSCGTSSSSIAAGAPPRRAPSPGAGGSAGSRARSRSSGR